MSDPDELIYVVEFRGRATEWTCWEQKFLAHLRRKGFYEALIGTIKVPPESEALDFCNHRRQREGQDKRAQ